LNNEGYRDSFRNILTYYEFLLLQIVISAEISQRGVLISNFYNVKRILYFPSPSNRIKLKRVNTKEYSDSYFESDLLRLLFLINITSMPFQEMLSTNLVIYKKYLMMLLINQDQYQKKIDSSKD
jgi:hypothetical protein